MVFHISSDGTVSLHLGYVFGAWTKSGASGAVCAWFLWSFHAGGEGGPLFPFWPRKQRHRVLGELRHAGSACQKSKWLTLHLEDAYKQAYHRLLVISGSGPFHCPQRRSFHLTKGFMTLCCGVQCQNMAVWPNKSALRLCSTKTACSNTWWGELYVHSYILKDFSRPGCSYNHMRESVRGYMNKGSPAKVTKAWNMGYIYVPEHIWQ